MKIPIQQFKQQAGKLLKYMMERLKIKSPPAKLVLKNNEENAKEPWSYTGDYNPETKTITIFITGRHHVDILRSMAHEIIHHWQNEHNQFLNKKGIPNDPQYAQKDPQLRKMEKQAYLLGNIIYRDWQDMNRNKN